MKRPTGFTLIELLVVITIIVVLLALLTPALDKALVEAEMAMCAANLKTIANGATMYGTSSKRHYPHRRAINASGQPNQLNDPWTGGGDPATTDDRVIMQDYLNVNAYGDPRCDPIDLGFGSSRRRQANPAQETPEPFVISGYQLFYGWQYRDPDANGNAQQHKGMRRIGDHFRWSGTNNLFNKSGAWRFNVLAADQNSMTRNLAGIASSHPDADGVLPIQTLNNEPVEANALGLNEGFYYIMSRWIIAESSQRRGTLDLNNVFSDGGVARMNGVAWDEEQRVTSAPITRDGPGQFDYWLILPAR